MQHKMTDSVLPGPVEFREIFVSFCHPTLCFVATKCLHNTPPPHRFHWYSEERAWQGGRGQFQGVRRRRQQPVCYCMCHFCTRMAGWVGLGRSSDVMRPHFVPTPAQPGPQVVLLLSVSSCHAASPHCLCVCVCSALGHFSFAAHMLLPIPFGPL